MGFGDNQREILSVSEGSGYFILFENGIAGSARANVSLDVPDLSVSGNFEIQINRTGSLVKESFKANGLKQEIDVVKGPYTKVVANGASLQFAGQTISGTFEFEQGSSYTQIKVSQFDLRLGDGNSDFVRVTGNSDNEGDAGLAGTMSINRDGMFGEFNGYISINVGTDPNKTGSDVSMGGTVSVNVDTRSTAVESLVVNVSNANINVLDQVISANSLSLVNKEHPSLGALTEMRMKGMNVSLGLEDGPTLEFSVSESVAVINSQGMAMRVDGGSASISGGSVSLNLNASADILLNTSSVQFDLDGAIVESGPYLRVEAQATLQVGVVYLQGGFVFDQSIEEKTDNSGAVISTETLTRVAVDQAKLEVDGNKVATADGAMIFKSGGGVAGVLTGSLEVDAGAVGLGAAVSVKINTTNGPVSQKVSLAGREFDIDLDKIKGVATDPDKPDEINTNGFDVVLSSFDIRIGNFIIVEGTENSATVFVGSGPLYLDDNKLEDNPAAKGLLIEDARFNHFNKGQSDESFVADGKLSVVGLPGLNFSADATIMYSKDGVSKSLPLPAVTGVNGKAARDIVIAEGVSTNVKVDITELEIEGQKLKGDFDFTFKDDGSILITLEDYSIGLGDGSTEYVKIEGTDSKISYSSAGFAGVLNGNVSFANDKMPDVEF